MKLIAISLAALLLAGCTTTEVVPDLQPREEAAIVFENFDNSWLTECQLLDPAQIGGTKGELLLEYIEVAGLLAQCAARHESLTTYLKPLVDKAKGIQRRTK